MTPNSGRNRAGQRSGEPRFWIRLKRRFVRIRSCAVRDFSGDYRGTREVSRDIP
jgi:DUF438 domain-containing protein